MAGPEAFDLNDLSRRSHQQISNETWLAPQFTTGGWSAICECNIYQGQYHKIEVHCCLPQRGPPLANSLKKCKEPCRNSSMRDLTIGFTLQMCEPSPEPHTSPKSMSMSIYLYTHRHACMHASIFLSLSLSTSIYIDLYTHLYSICLCVCIRVYATI